MTDPASLPAGLAEVIAQTRGFMPTAEADALRAAAADTGGGLWLEVGTYCGLSTLHLAAVAHAVGAQLVTLDHHHGSEENQPGWEYHDPETVDPYTGRMDTLPFLRHALHDAGLEAAVSVLVATTQQVAAWWTTPVNLLFLDGNHTHQVAQHDYAAFAPHLVRDGLLAVHDVFPDPADGGRPPYDVVQRALGSGAFERVGGHGSLWVLRRTNAPV